MLVGIVYTIALSEDKLILRSNNLSLEKFKKITISSDRNGFCDVYWVASKTFLTIRSLKHPSALIKDVNQVLNISLIPLKLIHYTCGETKSINEFENVYKILV